MNFMSLFNLLSSRSPDRKEVQLKNKSSYLPGNFTRSLLIILHKKWATFCAGAILLLLSLSTSLTTPVFSQEEVDFGGIEETEVGLFAGGDEEESTELPLLTSSPATPLQGDTVSGEESAKPEEEGNLNERGGLPPREWRPLFLIFDETIWDLPLPTRSPPQDKPIPTKTLPLPVSGSTTITPSLSTPPPLSRRTRRPPVRYGPPTPWFTATPKKTPTPRKTCTPRFITPTPVKTATPRIITPTPAKTSTPRIITPTPEPRYRVDHSQHQIVSIAVDYDVVGEGKQQFKQLKNLDGASVVLRTKTDPPEDTLVFGREKVIDELSWHGYAFQHPKYGWVMSTRFEAFDIYGPDVPAPANHNHEIVSIVSHSQIVGNDKNGNPIRQLYDLETASVVTRRNNDPSTDDTVFYYSEPFNVVDELLYHGLAYQHPRWGLCLKKSSGTTGVRTGGGGRTGGRSSRGGKPTWGSLRSKTEIDARWECLLLEMVLTLHEKSSVDTRSWSNKAKKRHRQLLNRYQNFIKMARQWRSQTTYLVSDARYKSFPKPSSGSYDDQFEPLALRRYGFYHDPNLPVPNFVPGNSIQGGYGVDLKVVERNSKLNLATPWNWMFDELLPVYRKKGKALGLSLPKQSRWRKKP